MSSQEFVAEAAQNKTGKNVGKRAIWFNGRDTRAQTEHVKPRYRRYVATSFRRLIEDDPEAPFARMEETEL